MVDYSNLTTHQLEDLKSKYSELAGDLSPYSHARKIATEVARKIDTEILKRKRCCFATF